MAEKSKKGLGKGMGALFGEETIRQAEKEVQTLPITRVQPREDQPRSNFDEQALSELADSIREYGLIQPITVRKLENGYYQIIAGERRWRASRLAGLKEVPVRVLEADDQTAMQMALVENLQREDLNPIEEARGYRVLMETYGLTQEQTAESVGRSRSAIANTLGLLRLSEPVLKLVESGELSAGHARALIPIQSEELQLSAAKSIISQDLSVRQTEALAARLIKQEKAQPKTPAADLTGILVDYVEEVRSELERSLGRRVKIRDGRKSGRIELEYYDADDREALFASLRALSYKRKK